MSNEKDLLRQKFSAEPDKYYKVAIFEELGFQRKRCPSCHRYFWTIDGKREVCPEQPCQNYTFLGRTPTSQKLDYISTWKKVDDFFKKNGHHSLKRYPVVCRWRPDLYFTVASIVDFQRVESGRVVFEFPSNPVIVPQMCLRFLDIGNVGITGRHYTSFCMIGQAALSNSQGYWKDRCIELDFSLLTQELKIPKEEVVFKEDVWLGPGAFGNSLEYYVRGLELGNAVFTAYEGTADSYKEYPEKVVDMGAGLERLTWITQGTYSSYEAVFPEVIAKFREATGLFVEDTESMRRYFELAGSLDIEQFKGQFEDYELLATQLGIVADTLRKNVELARAIYSIIDHTRTLVFAISDGALPSNVGGGYNLRVILRRALDYLAKLEVDVKLETVATWHIDHLSRLFPELAEHREDVSTVLGVEERKYVSSLERSRKIVDSLSRKKSSISEERLEQMYDSEGITPEALEKAGLHVDLPADFYSKITEKHMAERHPEGQEESFDVTGLPPTTLIFYLNRDQFEFRATVLRIINERYVILDNTAFFARSGGQEPDHGTINGLYVSDVMKFNNVVLHKIEGIESERIRVGEEVSGLVDAKRRSLIMRHHTATHIINGACRKLIGPWVWQHSAFKDEDVGRLDITHFAHLTREQVLEIERTANDVVRSNLPVIIKWIPRNQAEATYGFRLYQGGVVPVKELRIVNIQGWDVEACGGTHCSTTGEVGMIKITKAERVQDGVERLEFVAGEAAVNYIQRQESILMQSAGMLQTPADKLASSVANTLNSLEEARRSSKNLAKRLADFMIVSVPKEAQAIEKVKLYVSPPSHEGLDLEYHVAVGDKLSRSQPELVYVGFFNENDRTRVVAFCGSVARNEGVRANLLVKAITSKMGGSGGGDERFAQGGSQSIVSEVPSVLDVMKDLLTSSAKRVPS